jgi:ABC-type branched-subunit amino acid transport system ATPase component
MVAPLAAADVSVSFDGLTALSNVTLEVSRGRVMGLIGPNGAGKTTLLKVIAGTVKPSEGEVKSEGMRIDGRSPEDSARLGVSMAQRGARFSPRSRSTRTCAPALGCAPTVIRPHATSKRSARRFQCCAPAEKARPARFPAVNVIGVASGMLFMRP